MVPFKALCEIHVFVFVQTVDFHMVPAKVTCAFLAHKKQWRNYLKLTFFENDVIFHIFNPIKVLNVQYLF